MRYRFPANCLGYSGAGDSGFRLPRSGDLSPRGDSPPDRDP